MLLSNTAAMHCCHAWLASGVTSLLVTGRTRAEKILYFENSLDVLWVPNFFSDIEVLSRVVRGFYICPTEQALEIFELAVSVPSHTSSLCT
jgi:hypothetical protein